MSRIIDEAAACKRVHEFLGERGFVPRDADGSDLQRGTDTGLRFKIGTVYGEVAVHVLEANRLTHTIRILRDTKVDEALANLERIIYPAETIEVRAAERDEPVASWLDDERKVDHP